jgi:hypothetical protein
MEWTALKLDPLRFAVGEKCHGILVHERHIPQIEHHELPRRLGQEQLLELLDIIRLYPATEGEDRFTDYGSLNSEHANRFVDRLLPLNAFRQGNLMSNFKLLGAKSLA